MGSIIRRLIDRFYPDSQGHMVTIVGLDYSGKTTLLYLLKLGEIVTTISSIGFNVETVDIMTSNGKPFRMTGWDLGTGCAGLQYHFGMIRIYLQSSTALIWVVDSCDRNRLQESVDALNKILANHDADAPKDKTRPRLMPILILANKSDKPEAMPLDEIRISFSKATSGRLVSIFGTALTDKGLETTGLPEAFDWLNLALEIAKSSQTTAIPKGLEPATPNPREQAILSEKLELWLTRIETDLEPEEFLTKFRSFTLPSWDHYTHIRIAYVMLTKYGRREGKDMIFKGLEKYIAISPLTKGRSFHFTMTYFWIQIVHFGIRNMPPTFISNAEAKPISSSIPPAASAPNLLPSPNDFAQFLLINPYVVDGNLWADYYTKDVLMSLKAKGEMVLPDKKPLPNLVVRDAINTVGNKG
ncbi:hypothetical protein M413DRAFT_17481 [Hebeloma cylindrosporum]|uniref:Uncharacterized protein n=1 Tax=Hebeloma cylindrosporum TaxID=76867 RepID=A0A0C2Y716_HEBCY|nr:hypothetical protein M413DRAFT_17481 [Hebeloma cylindrosporum h7]